MLNKRLPTLREAKYKKTVEAVYGDNGPNTHNIQSLQQYALMTPGKLPKIGKYLLNKSKEGIKEKKKGITTVETSMIIFNELIKTCHSDLALFANPICEMMRYTLKSPFLELKAAGTETFIKFSEHGGIQYELEEYVNYFIEMSGFVNLQNIEEERLTRSLGLRGLHSYIIMTEDLDNLIANFVDNSKKSNINLLPIFLDNMQYEEEEGEGEGKKKKKKNTKIRNNEEDLKNVSIASLGTLCLKDMSTRVNHITVRPLCESLLTYIDKKKLWDEPNQFAIEVLQTLSIGVLPQLKSTVIRFLLEHIDKQSKNSISTKTSIIQCIKEILPQNNISQQLSDVLTSMIRLISTKDGFSDELAQAAVSCISHISEHQIAPLHQLESLRELLLAVTNPISFESKLSLCQAITNGTNNLKPLPLDKAVPPSLIEHWCVASMDHHEKIRGQLLLCLLTILKQTSLLKRMNSGGIRNSNFIIPYDNSLSQIHSSLLRQTQYNNNTPIHYELIFQIHCCLFEELKYTGLISLLPNLFHLQETSYDDLKDNNACVHTLILALYLKISSFYSIPELLSYIKEIYTKRKEENQLSHAIIIDIENSNIKVTDDILKDKDIHVTLLFDNNKIIELLSSDKELSLSCDLPSLLEKDIDSIHQFSPIPNLGELTEERKLRKQIAVSVSRNIISHNKKHIQEENDNNIKISEWNTETFKEYLCYSDNQKKQKKPKLYSFLDISPLVEDINNKYTNELSNSFTNLSLESDLLADEKPSSFLDLKFPSMVNFI